jgi:hypothetical protein
LAKALEFNVLGFAIGWFFDFAATGDAAKVHWFETDFDSSGQGNDGADLTVLTTTPNFIPIPFVKGVAGPGHVIPSWDDDGVGIDAECRSIVQPDHDQPWQDGNGCTVDF